jgi:hypothetical protein
MKRTKISRFSMALSLAAVIAGSTAIARADAWDKKTTITFSHAVEVPGSVLQPGKYVMKLADANGDRHIVQFMNERGDHVYAAAQAISAYRPRVTSRTVITFYEAREGRPEPMRTWFYPGDEFGQQFVYSPSHLTEVASVNNTTSTTTMAAAAPIAESPVTAAEPVNENLTAQAAPAAPATEPQVAESTESAAPVEIAQAEPPQQTEPAPAVQNDTPQATQEFPRELPKTASDLAEIAMLGVIFVGGAITARKARLS